MTGQSNYEGLTLASLFDGSGGFPLAGTMNGIEPVWASEVEPYPIAVSKSHFPDMLHLGSVTEIDGGRVPAVDIITFGSPCQDLSVAGNQKGIHDGERSSLFFQAVQIIKEMREATNGQYPRYAVWENVPGAFSSNQGHDFHAVLQALVEACGGCPDDVPLPPKIGGVARWFNAGEIMGDSCSLAWRILDAQYWGVPQRRKRIYLVTDFTGQRAGKILFERTGLRGNLQQSHEAGKGASWNAVGSAHAEDGNCLNPWDCQSKRIFTPNGVYPTLPAMDAGGRNNESICYSIDPLSSNSMKSSNPNSGFHEADTCKCLDTSDGNPSKNQGGMVVVSAAAFMGGQGAKAGGIGYSEEVSPTLKSVMSGGNTIPDVVHAYGVDCRNCVLDSEKTHTLQAKANGGQSLNCMPSVVYPIHDKATRFQGGGDTRNGDGSGNGLGVGNPDDPAYTLTAMDKHAVCYPNTANTLISRHDSSPCIDRGMNVVCYDARGNGTGNVVPNLTGDHENRVTDYTALCVSNGQLHQMSMLEQSNTLDCMHDKQIVMTRNPRYVVRRLTPTECARLQGFPDAWGKLPVEEHIDCSFWKRVRTTKAVIDGKAVKDWTDKQMVDWYNKLYSESAEYKMWGNGIALPCAAAVLGGIAEVEKE